MHCIARVSSSVCAVAAASAGETYRIYYQQAEDDDTAAEAFELAPPVCRFATAALFRESNRWRAAVHSTIRISPMKVLADEAVRTKPLFTPGVMPESTPVQQPVAPASATAAPVTVAPQPQYQQPQQPVAPHRRTAAAAAGSTAASSIISSQQPVAPQPQYQQPQQRVAPSAAVSAAATAGSANRSISSRSSR